MPREVEQRTIKKEKYKAKKFRTFKKEPYMKLEKKEKKNKKKKDIFGVEK